jgi:hypothetical protein
MKQQNKESEEDDFQYFPNLILCGAALVFYYFVGNFIWQGCTSSSSTNTAKEDNLPAEFANWSCEALKHHSKWRQYEKNGCNK